ncbi:MAG: YicC family protein [Lentisphaerae bacterium]|nr:YicC family protein [Lentisphaerota bacterium]
MTGFGRGEAAASGLKVEVELSSVNRRQCDVRLSLPSNLMAWEAELSTMIHDAVSRGYVRGHVKTGASAQVRRRRMLVDAELAGTQLRRLRETAARLGLEDDITARSLIELPDVVRYEERPEEARRFRPLLRRAMRDALGELLAMREREGRHLEAQIVRDLSKAGRIVKRIRKRAPAAVRAMSRALRRRLRERDVDDDNGSLHRELAIMADRCDISEELVRLESHLKQAEQMIAGQEPAGRPLDFLCQEMLREINTIGSKANDARVSAEVVTFKTLLEVIREQVQNVE